MATAHASKTVNRQVLKEQFRLFAFGSSQPSPATPEDLDRELSARERLITLLEGDLNFHGSNGSYASHDVHAFAAKFPPQLPRAFIRGLTKPGDIVLDPMMGSGTAIVEAQIEGRNGIGLDIDPLALQISRAKTTLLDTTTLAATGAGIVAQARTLLADRDAIEATITKRFDEKTKSFIDYWFFPDTQCELMALTLAIQEEQDRAIRRFLELTFSAIIVTKSGGVSRARDLAHSRPHLVPDKVPKNAIDQFVLRLKKNVVSITRLTHNGIMAAPLAGDARAMPLRDGTVNLIVTSPPYANAIDYMRAHKFSLVWLGRTVSELSDLRSKYVGSERAGNTEYPPLPERTERIVSQLAEKDRGKARVLRKYYVEMGMILSEMYRVLQPGASAIMVVGTSIMRGIDVQTQYCLAEIAADIGFDVAGVVQRELDRNKRMMPARFGKKGDSMIEQRMHEECVIGLLKPNLPPGAPHADA
jgi:DNA modification methylase